MSEASQEIMQEAMEAAISTDQEEMTSKWETNYLSPESNLPTV
jgi:hypothetical protein